MVAQLAEDAGGKKNQNRWFVSSIDRAMAYQRALTNFEMDIAGSQAPTPLTRDRQTKALLIPRLVAEKAGFFPTVDTPELTSEPIEAHQLEAPVVIAIAPNPEHIAASPTETIPEPIEVQLTETTSPHLPTGTWEPEEPAPLNPDSATFEQWKQTWGVEGEQCAA